MQRACKPGSVIGSHLSGTDIAARLEPPVWRLAEQTVAPQVGVASDRVYRMPRLPGTPVGSYPTFPPFPRRSGVVCFCCTCPAVARGRCYRLSCSVKPGLSSQGCPCAAARPAAVFIISAPEKKVNVPWKFLNGIFKEEFRKKGWSFSLCRGIILSQR